MKTGIISDIHLGAGQQLGVGEYGEGSRFADQVAVLERCAETFIAEGCDVVCCLGDVFHSPHPKPWEILAWHRFLGRIDEDDIRAITILGNHDARATMLPTALDLAASAWHDVVTRPKIVPFHRAVFVVDVPAVYALLPWTPTSTLVAKEGRDGHTRDRAIDLLVATTRQLRDECAAKYPDATPILLGHWHLTGGKLPTGLPTDDLAEPVIPWFDIDAQGWTLAAFGHLHSAGFIAEGQAETRIFHAGSVMVTNLGEIGQDHGVWIYDHDTDELRFVPIQDRPFVDYVEGEIVPPGAVVRFRYRANGEKVDEAAMRRALEAAGAHRVFIKQIDKPQVSRARIEAAPQAVEETTAADALGLYLDANDVAAARNGDADRFVAAMRERHQGYVERIGNA